MHPFQILWQIFSLFGLTNVQQASGQYFNTRLSRLTVLLCHGQAEDDPSFHTDLRIAVLTLAPHIINAQSPWQFSFLRRASAGTNFGIRDHPTAFGRDCCLTHVKVMADRCSLLK